MIEFSSLHFGKTWNTNIKRYAAAGSLKYMYVDLDITNEQINDGLEKYSGVWIQWNVNIKIRQWFVNNFNLTSIGNVFVSSLNIIFRIWVIKSSTMFGKLAFICLVDLVYFSFAVIWFLFIYFLGICKCYCRVAFFLNKKRCSWVHAGVFIKKKRSCLFVMQSCLKPWWSNAVRFIHNMLHRCQNQQTYCSFIWFLFFIFIKLLVKNSLKYFFKDDSKPWTLKKKNMACNQHANNCMMYTFWFAEQE